MRKSPKGLLCQI